MSPNGLSPCARAPMCLAKLQRREPLHCTLTAVSTRTHVRTYTRTCAHPHAKHASNHASNTHTHTNTHTPSTHKTTDLSDTQTDRKTHTHTHAYTRTRTYAHRPCPRTPSGGAERGCRCRRVPQRRETALPSPVPPNCFRRRDHIWEAALPVYTVSDVPRLKYISNTIGETNRVGPTPI